MKPNTFSRERIFAERLLALMDQKHHWAYESLTKPGLARSQLLIHFRHEYLVYVRDFPILLARALGQVPALPDVRHALAENIYEEQTGGVSKTGPHPDLFLRMMAGLGFARGAFVEDDVSLHPAAISYRDFLREMSASTPWQVPVALLTIFVEGSKNERAELAGTYVRPPSDVAIAKHPLVVHYGCPVDAMELARAHAAVEGGHRTGAWDILLEHTLDGSPTSQRIVDVCQRALAAWQRYRDGVAERMGLSRDECAA